MARGIFEFFRLRQTLRIEHAAPRLEIPAADADVDVAEFAIYFFIIEFCWHGGAQFDAASRAWVRNLTTAHVSELSRL